MYVSCEWSLGGPRLGQAVATIAVLAVAAAAGVAWVGAERRRRSPVPAATERTALREGQQHAVAAIRCIINFFRRQGNRVR